MSNYAKYFFWIIISIGFLACGKKEDSEILVSTDQSGELVYQMDTVKINIDDQSSYTYHRFNTFEQNGRYYFVKYQGSSHSFLFYDIDKKRLTQTIKMEKGGPHGISNLQNFYIHNLDSIFVFGVGNMKIMNEDAEVFFRMNLYEQAPQDLFIDFANAEAKPFYNPYLKKVILKNSLRRNASSSEREKSFLATIDLETKAFESIGPQHAPFMKDAKVGYGSYQGVHFTSFDSLVFYNYAVSSSLFSYNLLTQETKSAAGDVTSIPNQAAEFKNAPTQAFINAYRFETPVFYNVLYDPYRQLYYRLHRTGKPYEPTMRNTLQHTTFYLSVFGREMELLDEIKLGKNIYSQFSAFVMPQGLFLNAAFKDFPLLEESKMIFHVFDFSFQ